MFFLKHKSNFDIAQGIYLLEKEKKTHISNTGLQDTKISRTNQVSNRTEKRTRVFHVANSTLTFNDVVSST